MRTLGLAVLLTSPACVIFKPEAPLETGIEADVDVDSDADSDTDTDTDSDADTDTDTDADTDTDTDADSGGSGGDGGTGGDDTGGSMVDCDSERPGSTPIDACVARELSCGDRIRDTTVGGTDLFDGDDYETWYCTWGESYDGPERVYAFTHPGGVVNITLDSPCAELHLIDLRWEYWESDDECPDDTSSINECDVMDDKDGGTLQIYQTDPDRAYLIIVDGPDGDEVPYALTVSCE